MLKQILSVSDVKKLQVGDQLFDNAEMYLAKIFVIQNVADNMIYAIHEDGRRELRILKTDEVPNANWWIKRE